MTIKNHKYLLFNYIKIQILQFIFKPIFADFFDNREKPMTFIAIGFS